MAKEIKECPEAIKPYVTFETQLTSRVIHVYLNTLTGDPLEYAELFHSINSACAEDVIYIHLNTPGGRLDVGVQLINAMQSTPAHVITAVEAEAHSLGTIIFLASDEWVVHDSCTFMIHNYSGGVVGKGNEQHAQLEATIQWFNDLANRFYYPFLSKKEIKKIIRGEDMWLHSEEIRTRLNTMVKFIKKRNAKNEKKQLDQDQMGGQATIEQEVKKSKKSKNK